MSGEDATVTMTESELKSRVHDALQPGRLFADKYRIEGAIGSGNFAYVLKALHEVMDRDVALKVLKPDLVESRKDIVERFLGEVRIVSKLRHPNTVTVFDFGTTPEGISYMVMEFVDGTPLDQVLAECGALEPRRVVRILKQILKSLDEAHSHGIVHRDLKPSNIMLTELHGEADFVKVLDFGVAKLAEPQAQSRNEFTRRSTQFVGTPIYMSPEQVLGETIVPASDLYSLGLVAYEMLTGEDPIEAPNVASVAQIHIDDEPIPFAALDRLTTRFQKLILKATARDPGARFQSVTEFARQLPQMDVEYSEEFSGLLLDQLDAGTDRDGLDEISENTWDFFSGKNYIEPPDESEASDERRRRRRPRRDRPRKKPARMERDVVRPQPRSGLEVDVGRVRRDEIRRQREREAHAAAGRAAASSGAGRSAWYAAGLFALYVSFVVASTVFFSSDGWERWVVGALPAGATLLWTQFSDIRRVHGTFGERWLEPSARRMIYTTLILLAVVAVVLPADAASRLDQNAAWFVDRIPQEHALHIVASATSALGEALAAVFSVASKVIPW